MYCTNCGHPIQDSDRFCGNCGSPISQEAESAGRPVQEEVIYNAPSGSVQEEDSSHYPREMSLVFEEKEEREMGASAAVGGGASEKEFQEEESQEERSECTCDFSEFSWNVQDFPKPQKVDQVPIRWGVSSESAQRKDPTADEPFVWNLGDLSEQSRERQKKESVQQSAPGEPAPEPYVQKAPMTAGTAVHELTEEEADRIRRLEDEIFGEAKASKRIKVGEADHMGNDAEEVFFTFSKKNEEFQKLLDREYDKVQKRMREDRGEKQGASEKIEISSETQSNLSVSEGRPSLQAAPEAHHISSAMPGAAQTQPEAPFLSRMQSEAVPVETKAPHASQLEAQAQPDRSLHRPQISQAQPEIFLHRPDTYRPRAEAPQAQPDISLHQADTSRPQAKTETTRKTKPISRDEVKEAVKKYIINLGSGAEMPSVSQALPAATERFCQPESLPKSEAPAQPGRKPVSSAFLSGQSGVSIPLDQAAPDPVGSDHAALDQMSDRILPEEVLADRKTFHDFRLMQETDPLHTDFHEIGNETEEQAQSQVKRPVGYVNPQADEMVMARAGFFGSTASLDYVQVEQEESRDKQDAPSVQEGAETNRPAEENYNPTAAPGNFYYEGPKSSKKKKRLRIVRWVVLGVVVLALVVEGAALGIKYFAPQSVAAVMIERAEQSMLGLFQKKDGEPMPDTAQPMDQTSDQSQENLPTATMDELIQQQIGNNYDNNIVKVESNPNLKYDPQKDYGVADVNSSMPIMDNFWLESNGIRYNYDATVVGTAIAYCSKWMSFVNKGDESVFSMLASGGAADQRAKEYKLEKGVHETMTSLQLGEIRKGANGFYIWTQQDITVVRGGQSQQKKQNYIYYMAPNGRAFQVIDYYPY